MFGVNNMLATFANRRGKMRIETNLNAPETTAVKIVKPP